jgi:hypothetical protein
MQYPHESRALRDLQTQANQLSKIVLSKSKASSALTVERLLLPNAQGEQKSVKVHASHATKSSEQPQSYCRPQRAPVSVVRSLRAALSVAPSRHAGASAGARECASSAGCVRRRSSACQRGRCAARRSRDLQCEC